MFYKRQKENNEKISRDKTVKELKSVKQTLLRETYLIFYIKLITGFEPWCVQFTLVVLQILGTERKVRGSDGGQRPHFWSRSSLTSRDLQRSQNEFTRLQLMFNHYITVLSDGLYVSHQQVLHHFDLLIDMVEDLSAELCALLDPLLLCRVLCGETRSTELRKMWLSQQSPNKSHKSWVYTKIWAGQ